MSLAGMLAAVAALSPSNRARLTRAERTPPNTFARRAAFDAERRGDVRASDLRAANRAAAAERRAERDARMARRAARPDASAYAKRRAAELGGAS